MAERPKRHSGVAAAWAVLIGMGGTSVTYNVYHAVTHGQMVLALALLYGIAPVFAAACLSHIVAVHDGGWFMRGVAFAVMLGAMSLSIGATASVIAPTAGHLRWLFGGVLDAAALVALRVILDRRERDAAAVSAMEEAEQRAAAAESETAVLSAELDRVRTALETAELDRSRAAVADRSGPVRKTASRKRPATPRGRAAAVREDDIDLEARALDLLSSDPEMSGTKLAAILGVTDSYGRKLKRRLADRHVDSPQAPSEPAS